MELVDSFGTTEAEEACRIIKFLNDAMDSKFGFSSFAETWNGRLAMMGFIIGLGTDWWVVDSICRHGTTVCFSEKSFVALRTQIFEGFNLSGGEFTGHPNSPASQGIPPILQQSQVVK